MALTGFDPSVVRTSIASVREAYDSLIHAFGYEMQSKIVDGMADKWACNDAQKFFGDVKSDVDSLVMNINTVFESIASSMNSAARGWAESTGTDYSDVSFTPIDQKLNIGNIMENIGGVRGIDLQQANSVISYLPTITSNSDDALAAAKQAVATSGFVGGDMQANINASLDKIKTDCHNSIDAIDSAAKEAMDATVTAYGDLEGKVAQAFAGQN